MERKDEKENTKSTMNTKVEGWITIPLGAAVLLSSGFFMGWRRSRGKKDDMELKNNKNNNNETPYKKYHWWERRLGLHQNLKPSVAASKALTAATGLCFSIFGLSIVSLGFILNVRSPSEFTHKMQGIFPRFRQGIINIFHIKPKYTKEEQEQLEKQDLEYLEDIFSKAMTNETDPTEKRTNKY